MYGPPEGVPRPAEPGNVWICCPIHTQSRMRWTASFGTTGWRALWECAHAESDGCAATLAYEAAPRPPFGALQQWLQPGHHAALPVDQGAVDIEGQGSEIRQLHGRLSD